MKDRMRDGKGKTEYPVSREKNPVGQKANLKRTNGISLTSVENPSVSRSYYKGLPVVDTPMEWGSKRKADATKKDDWEDFFIEKLNEKRKEKKNGTGNYK